VLIGTVIEISLVLIEGKELNINIFKPNINDIDRDVKSTFNYQVKLFIKQKLDIELMTFYCECVYVVHV
jgi:hypothetical protein